MYCCDICGASINRYNHIQPHMLGHINPKVPPTDGAKPKKHSRGGAKIDKAKNSQNQDLPQDCTCQICHETFETEAGLRIHIGRQHLVKSTEIPTHICHICGKTYHSYRGLSKHRAVHDDNVQLQKQKIFTEEKYPCLTCGNKFRTEKLLQIHFKMTHKAGSFYTCSSCGFKTDYKATLRLHTVQKHGYPLVTSEDEDEDPYIKKSRTNTDDKIFCPICNVLIKNKYYLTQHVRLHGPRNFHCSQCGKAFPGKSQLNLHVRTVHSNEKTEIPCHYCDQVFNEYRKRKRHEEKVHNVKGISKKERLFLDDIIPESSITAKN